MLYLLENGYVLTNTGFITPYKLYRVLGAGVSYADEQKTNLLINWVHTVPKFLIDW